MGIQTCMNFCWEGIYLFQLTSFRFCAWWHFKKFPGLSNWHHCLSTGTKEPGQILSDQGKSYQSRANPISSQGAPWATVCALSRRRMPHLGHESDSPSTKNIFRNDLIIVTSCSRRFSPHFGWRNCWENLTFCTVFPLVVCTGSYLHMEISLFGVLVLRGEKTSTALSIFRDR